MQSIDVRMVLEGLVTLIFTLVGLWLAAEKSAIKESLQTGLRNVRTELDTTRKLLEARIDQGERAHEGLEKDLKSWLERLERKLDKVLER
jgi:hypothetical protein